VHVHLLSREHVCLQRDEQRRARRRGTLLLRQRMRLRRLRLPA
jgi:hypothetical protein